MTPYYADESVTLHHGDALEVLPTLPSQSFAVVVLDPPYSMVPSAVRGIDDGAAGASGSPIRLLTETFRETYRLLASGGVAPIICDWRRIPDVSYLATLANLRLNTCLAWTRKYVGTGSLFRSSWDPVLVTSRGAVDPIDRAGIPNVIEAFVPPNRRVHPYEKPTALWGHIFNRLSLRGPILDPFAGSGSAANAARYDGRKAILIEADERYCELIARRMSQGVLAMDGAS